MTAHNNNSKSLRSKDLRLFLYIRWPDSTAIFIEVQNFGQCKADKIIKK